MGKEYAVLHEPGGHIDIVGERAVIGLTGVNGVFLDRSQTIRWLREKANRILIVIMPIEESERQLTARELSPYNNQCIAIDPGQLCVGSRPMFGKTQTLHGSVFAQIRDIIEDKKD